MKFRRILFPVDFSKRSYATVPWVKSMQARFAAKLTLLHAAHPAPLDWPPPPLMGESGETSHPWVLRESIAQLEKFAETEFAGVEVDLQVEEGEAGEVIATASAEADLIMMPTHGRGRFRATLLGSTASKVLHDTKCAVWTSAHTEEAHKPESTEYRNIICAVDTVHDSVSEIRAAAAFGAEWGARVWLVHAVPARPAAPGLYFDQEFERFLSDAAAEEIGIYQKEAGTDLTVVIEPGNVSEVIRDACLANQGDLVVTGRGALPSFAGPLRTHALAIIRDAPCPVLSF